MTGSSQAAPERSFFQIGLWGTSGAGKTTYLAMLYEALANDAGITVAADQHARAFARTYRGDIKDRGQFPMGTLPRDSLDQLHYSIYPELDGPNGEQRPFDLAFIDAPGGYYENLDGSDTVQGERTILDFLMSCHGIIFLLDPERVEGPDAHNYRRLLDTLMQNLVERSLKNDHGPRPQQYMAFCVTKVDEETWWSERDKPELLVERIIGKDMFRQLNTQYCRKGRYHCFALSAIGRRPDPNDAHNLLLNVEKIQSAPTPKSQDTLSHVSSRPRIQPVAARKRVEPEPSVSDADDFDASFRSKDPDELPSPVNSSPKRIIERGEAINPIGLIEPIHWLIGSIHAEPPDIQPRG